MRAKRQYKDVTLRWRLSYKWAFRREAHIRAQLEAQLVAARAEKDQLEQTVKEYREAAKRG